MRILLASNGSPSCKMDEVRRDIYINGTRITGCVHSDEEYRKNVTIIIVLTTVIPMSVVLIVLACCLLRKWHPPCCSRPPAMDEQYIIQCLGDDMDAFLTGHITKRIKEAIGEARAKDGPLTNGKFESYFRHHVNRAKCDFDDFDAWLENVCFEIRNIQPPCSF